MYRNLAIFLTTHFWRLKTSKITFIFEFLPSSSTFLWNFANKRQCLWQKSWKPRLANEFACLLWTMYRKSGDFLVYFIPHFWRLKPENSLSFSIFFSFLFWLNFANKRKCLWQKSWKPRLANGFACLLWTMHRKSGDFLVYFIPHFWRLKPANSLFIFDFLFFFGEISPIKRKADAKSWIWRRVAIDLPAETWRRCATRLPEAEDRLFAASRSLARCAGWWWKREE